MDHAPNYVPSIEDKVRAFVCFELIRMCDPEFRRGLETTKFPNYIKHKLKIQNLFLRTDSLKFTEMENFIVSIAANLNLPSSQEFSKEDQFEWLDYYRDLILR